MEASGNEGGKRVVPFPEVTVILGDPRLPDATKVDACYSREDLESVERLKAALAELTEYRFTYLDDHATLLATLAASPPAFVFNLCDTGFRNDAAHELNIPAVLECLGVAYSGATPSCMAFCYDKGAVRALAAARGIPVPCETYLEPGAEAPLPVFPALIKPNRGDGSVGITRDSVVGDEDRMRACLAGLWAQWPGRAALVQEFLSGPEYGVALIGNPDGELAALPPLEVDYGALDPELPRILGYESKTIPSSPYWTKIRFHQARLDPAVRERLTGWSRTLFRRLGCRDYARFDFRADGRGEIKLLEVNANPAWCWDGKLNFMAGFAGWSYAELLRRILEAAQRRVAAARD